ncbi:MAG TPA: alkaline phosphatase D family protein [Aggregicoccus sp.]|nr:alkaline phosphatase D family protein [Aggregicoccus sp.]
MTSGFTRRSILKSIVVVSAASAGSGLLGACGGDDGGGGGSVTPGEQFFPQTLASGDPRPDSVVLWTRVVDGGGDRTLRLQVSRTEDFEALVAEQSGLNARAEHDGCIKVKVTGLEPRTTYYYRFIYEKDGTRYATRTGRTRTAPAATDDVPVRFAIANCQDFTGRYYNPHQRLLQLDAELDFVLCVGDYVYETAGDPAFQDTTSTRRVVFGDQAGAIQLGSAERPFYAANTVDNYRDLYRTYRTDAQLQALHERYAFIVMWDDHEFSDDSHGATGTYTDGRRDETDPERRRNAEQAFFEYLPVDVQGAGEGVLELSREQLYPQTKLWRDFSFGKNLDLVLTDYRSYRPDHLVPEDAFPGTVVMDQATLNAISTTIVPTLAQELFAYVDIDAPEYAQHKGALRQIFQAGYAQAGLGAEEVAARVDAAVRGKLSLQYVNGAFREAQLEPLLIDPAGKERGIAYVHFAKLELFTDIGSRYFATKSAYDLYAMYRYAASGGKSEDVWGAEQQAWLYRHLARNRATWRAVVSSVSFTAMPLKLSGKADLSGPGNELLRQDFNFNVDQWDGFPNKRRELLGVMAQNSVHNTLFLSGDIHASFVSRFGGAESNRAITAPAISSAPIRELIRSAVANTGLPTGEGTPFYKYVVTELDTTLQEGNADLLFTNTDHHGFVLVELEGGNAKATFHLIPQAESAVDYSGRAGELPGKFITREFSIPSTRPA